MIYKLETIAAIYSLIEGVKDDPNVGLKKFREAPTEPFSKDDTPAIAIMYGNDEIIKRDQRTGATFYHIRYAEAIYDIVAPKEKEDGSPLSIVAIWKIVRDAILVSPNPLGHKESMIEEIRTEGPNGYGLPGMLSMRLVLGIQYHDIVN